MRAVDNVIEWIKTSQLKNLSFMGKDMICYNAGCFINFINVITGEETHFMANMRCKNGEGVQMVRGHASLPVFAYPEYCWEPILFVRNFPDYEIIAQLSGGPAEGYSSISFSETSLLITVGDMPNFKLIVWDWRRSEKLGELATNTMIEEQMIRCSYSKPVNMAQLGTRSNTLIYWDVFTCHRKAVLAKHIIKLLPKKEMAPFTNLRWSTEGALFIVDKKGSVYTVDSEMNLVKIIEESISGKTDPSVCVYRGGVAISGPNNEVRYYKKSGSWELVWKITLERDLRHMYCNKSTDFLIGLTIDHEIIKIKSATEEIVYLKKSESNFNDICMVYPAGEYLVAIRRHIFLNVYKLSDGQLVNVFKLNDAANMLRSNPELPYVALCYKTGTLELISIYDPEKLSILTTFRLSTRSLQRIKFFEQGRVLVAANMDIGEFFIIEGYPGSEMKIRSNVNVNAQVVDYFLVASKFCFRLFVLPVIGNLLASNKVVRYCIMTNENRVAVKEYQMNPPNQLYYRIMAKNGPNRDRVFYALPWSSRMINVLETKRGDPVARLTGQIKSGHQLCKFCLVINKDFAITWGFDGFVFVRSQQFQEEIGMAIPTHRNYGGIRKAFIDPLGKHIVSLGRDHVIVCTNLVDRQIDEDKRKSIREKLESPQIALMFKRKTIGFLPTGRFEGKCWLEVKAIMEKEREEITCRQEKTKILMEFQSIKAALADLINRNMSGPQNEQLDLLEFNLDYSLYNTEKKVNREICKKTELYLKALIQAQDNCSSYMIRTYWDPMGIKGRIIRGIFSQAVATNYTLLPVNPVRLRQLEWLEETRRVEQYLIQKDLFEPWVILSDNKLQELLMTSVRVNNTDDYGTLHAIIDEDTNKPPKRDLETEIALRGTISLLYIELCNGHYRQNAIRTFYQCDMQQCIAEEEIMKLKAVYNKVFENMYATKQREMNNIMQKNARLRHIISEFNFFSDKKIDMYIEDPKWTKSENPEEHILKVSDNEVSVRPYISPSEQRILDAKWEEAERIRLALLADDFRERALMAMMNGVLEMRWEDELKKDVPMPKCMLEKQPEEFNEEDLRTVRVYEEQVTFLNSERERYKNILDVEFGKTAISVRDTIRKFNQKIRDTVELKMQIDSACNQENLKVNRARLNQIERIKFFHREEEIKKLLKENEEVMEQMQRTIVDLNEVVKACHETLDMLLNKDKQLEKAFKKDFQEYSSLVQDLCQKLYKKRPKATYRQITSGSVMQELARCVLTHEQSLILLPECHEYLRGLDQLDVYGGLPASVDQGMFATLCRHRRQKIEHEIKVRCYQVQIMDGESTIATFQKRLAQKREKKEELLAGLHKLRTDYLSLMHNIQVQVVLRRGLVEIPTTGDINDFKDAILVSKGEIEEINKFIVEAGNKKLKSIMQNISFRRNIMGTEWFHKKLRMEINDLIEHLNDIESCQFLKEMQNYLKNKSLGRKTDGNSYEEQVEALITTYDNLVKDKKERLLKINKQIKVFKESNVALDKTIKEINIDVCQLNLVWEGGLEDQERAVLGSRMKAVLQRNVLVQQIQQNHNDILVLQTELELLRLRTYPTFKYKLINN